MVACAALVLGPTPIAKANDAPYSGTVFVSSEVLTPSSPSDLLSVEYDETVNKRTFDRRVNAWINATSHVFSAKFECALENVDVIVNAEIDRQEAEVQASRFARILGQLPFGSRKAIRELWVHPGNELAGGGNSSILVYTGYADSNPSFLEEAFIHEAAHTSLDWAWGGAVNREAWQDAARSDGRFISQYASDNPSREDVAESYGAFLVHEASRTNEALRNDAERIGYTIPNRLNFFRSLGPEFGVSRDSCPKYTTANQQVDEAGDAEQGRTVVLAQRGKGTRMLGTSLSTSGVLKAKLGTKLKRGTQVSLILGKGVGEETLTRDVRSKGRINVRVNVASVQDVRIVDNRNRLVVRWRIR